MIRTARRKTSLPSMWMKPPTSACRSEPQRAVGVEVPAEQLAAARRPTRSRPPRSRRRTGERCARSSQSVMRDSVSVPITSTRSAPMAIRPWRVHEPVHEARAGGVDVERAATQAELVLHRGGVAPLRSGVVVASTSGVDLARVEARPSRAPARPDSIESPTVRAADAALADAGAGDDPLVARVHHLGQLVVREHLLRERGPPPRDHATSAPGRIAGMLRSSFARESASARCATTRSAGAA